MAFQRVYHMSNVRMPIKRVRNGVTCSNLPKFECCFLISKYHENCNAMSSFTVIRHVPIRHETLSFPLQLNVFISSLFFIYCLLSF